MKKLCWLILLLSLALMLMACEKPTQTTETTTEASIAEPLPDTLAFMLLDDGSYAVTGIGTYDDSLLVIPASWQGKPVTRIADNAFSECQVITEVTVPDSVTSVGAAAFANCRLLTRVTLSDSVCEIGVGAFALCEKLSEITLPSGILSIPQYAFSACGSLERIELPDGVCEIGDFAFAMCTALVEMPSTDALKTIGEGAFSECGFETLVFPDSLRKIGKNAFGGCASLVSVTLNQGLAEICENAFFECYRLAEVINHSALMIEKKSASQGAVALYASVVHTGKTTLVTENGLIFVSDGERAYLVGASEKVTEVSLPELHGGKAYEIRPYAFYRNKALTGVTAEGDILAIGERAFAECELLSYVCFEGAVGAVDDYAFRSSAKLAEAKFLTTSESFGEGIFSDCNALESLTVPYIGKSIAQEDATVLAYFFGASATDDKNQTVPHSLKSVILTQSRTLADHVFDGCDMLTEVVLPEGLLKIGYRAFSSCSSLVEIQIPSSVETIDSKVFAGCLGLVSVTMTDSVKTLGSAAFVECQMLREIVLSNNIERIEEKTFFGCVSLDTLVLPEALTAIGDSAFDGCSFTSLTLPAGVAHISEEAFFNAPTFEIITVSPMNTHFSSVGNCLVDVASGVLLRGTSTTVIPSSVREIAANAFKGCDKLKTIEIPAGVTRIGSGAFWGCTALEGITVSKGVLEIGEGAFADCSSLTRVEIQEGVTKIGSHAFANCSALKVVLIPKSVIGLDGRVFVGCSSLESITVPDFGNPQSALDSAYLGNLFGSVEVRHQNTVIPKSLRTVVVTDMTVIDPLAFYKCENIISITLGEGVKMIGDNAFDGCKALEEVYLPATVLQIGTDVFKGCSALKMISVDPANTYYSSEGNCLVERENGKLLRGTNMTVIPMGVKKIAANAFDGCSALSEIEIPASVQEIGKNAFKGCASLSEIKIPASVQKVGEKAFEGCTSLTRVVVSSKVGGMGYFLFKDCQKLTVYCEASERPSNWDEHWNLFELPVIWGYVTE